jgi:signal transduction histidine kinase
MSESNAPVRPAGGARRPASVPFSRRLAVRLSALVLALVVGLGAVLVWATGRAAEEAVAVADQELHRDLAARLAPRFQPHLMTDIDSVAIQQTIDGLTQVNRRLDVYLLGSEGMIKSWFSDARRRPLEPAVQTASLDAFLAGAALPLLGPDPARPGTERPFSVAPIQIMGEHGCYLYLVLQGERYDAVAASARRQSLAGTALGGLVLALLVAALVGVAAVVWLTRPLGRLAETVGAFERGGLAVRAHAGPDEVGRLGAAFNRMAARIEAQVEALRRTDAQRRELVANVSHDLRSPLAALRGYLETVHVMGDRAGPDERRTYTARALRSAERLSALVTDLFDLARFDAAEVRAELEPTALAELVADVVAECQGTAEARGVGLRVRAEDGLGLVAADARLAERAVANLVDNALRHTPPGGSVSVDVSRADGGGVAVAVRDTGEGIAPDVLPRVFDRFVRADASRTGGGAGLGLAIVKRIVDLHRGTVRVESVLGAGATFTAVFPAASVPRPAPAGPVERAGA